MVAGWALLATAALAPPAAAKPRVLTVTPAAAAAKSVRVMRLRIDYSLSPLMMTGPDKEFRRLRR